MLRLNTIFMDPHLYFLLLILNCNRFIGYSGLPLPEALQIRKLFAHNSSCFSDFYSNLLLGMIADDLMIIIFIIYISNIQHHNTMEPENPLSQQAHQARKTQLIVELLEFGFDQFYVQKAVEITLDKQKAAEIVIKLVEEGPDADLSAYKGFKQGIIQVNAEQMQNIQQPSVGGNYAPIKPNRAKLILIVNGALKMGKGKVCAQVGHGVIGAYLQIQQSAKFDEKSRLRLHSWENSGGAKIAVKAKNYEQMLQIKQKLQKLDIGINIHLVQDAGHTQIQAGSKTVMAVGPAFSDQIDPITSHLKLL